MSVGKTSSSSTLNLWTSIVDQSIYTVHREHS